MALSPIRRAVYDPARQGFEVVEGTPRIVNGSLIMLPHGRKCLAIAAA